MTCITVFNYKGKQMASFLRADGTWTAAQFNPEKTPEGWDRGKTWLYISGICDRIRANEATEDDWAFLKWYGHPTLYHEMIKYVCKRHAGIVE